MTIAILGGAGVRVPLLVGGLARARVPVERIALFDTDRSRLACIADLARRAAPGVRVDATATAEAAIDGAQFVIASLRVGGARQRARDEQIAIAHGIVGQETVGPAGFAMALRTIPAMIEYGRLIAARAPNAWLVNFTNPVSLVTQAVHQHSAAHVVGICDTPMELLEDTARALGLPARECRFDFFGLNHLGWLREVYTNGEPHLHRLWDDPARLAAVYRTPLFEPGELARVKLLPTEYVYYYYHPDRALDALRRSGTSRGAIVADLTDALFADLASGAVDPLARYEQYLAARDAGYMQLEAGRSTPRERPEWAVLSGYDRIAAMTIEAIAGDQRLVLPLDVANHGTLPFLADDDIIEVPCVVGSLGPHAVDVPAVPDHARELMIAVKAYERAAVAAAVSGRIEDQIEALALNPLVPSLDAASALVHALLHP
ncbi:MAG: 6-phospho-beta-glucosidase [Acidobacteriota bacterium]